MVPLPLRCYIWILLYMTPLVLSNPCLWKEYSTIHINLSSEDAVPAVNLLVNCNENSTINFYQEMKGCLFPSVKAVKFKFCHFSHEPLETILMTIGVNITSMEKVILSHPEHSGSLNSNFLNGLLNLERFSVRDGNYSSIAEGSFDAVFKLKNLELSNNNFNTLLPNVFSSLKNLKLLRLDRNKMETLSEELFDNLTRLEYLYLLSNDIEQLPYNIFFPLESLKILDLRSNKLNVIHEDLFSENPLLESIDISRNNLSSISERQFENCTELKRLSIISNNIETLPETIFQSNTKLRNLNINYNYFITVPEILIRGLTELETINLSNNNLEMLPENFIETNKQLMEVDFHGNSLQEIPGNFFKKANKLKKVYLNNNNISALPSGVFSTSISLQILHLQSNKLSSLILGTLSNDRNVQLEELNLSKNQLTTTGLFPFYPSETSALSNQVNLTSLDLSFNQFDELPVFHSLMKLKNFNLKGNLIETLDFIYLPTYPNNMKIDLSSNMISTVLVPKYSQSTNGISLSLSENPMMCNCNLYGFVNFTRGDNEKYPNIEVSDLDQITCDGPGKLVNKNLKQLPIKEFVCLLAAPHPGCSSICDCTFHPHVSTMEVNCSGRHLESIPTVRPNKRYIYSYDLSRNHIETFNFTNNTDLKIVRLSLSDNNLSEDTMDKFVRFPPGLKYLDLRKNKFAFLTDVFLERLNDTDFIVDFTQNPWKCNCQLKALRNFIQARVSLVEKIEHILCVGYNRPLYELKAEDICLSSLRLTIITVFPLLAVFIAVVGTVVFFHHKVAIQVWLFSHNMCLWLVTEDEVDVDKEYDAFLSYSHKDEDFVNKYLLPGLEGGDTRYRVCIHLRDWVPGEFIQTQILNSVSSSRRTLVILSKNFIDSVWGQMEFRVAHQQALKDKTNRVIVIVYGEMPPIESLDEELRHYIKLHTYLEWGNPKFWDNLRYAMPHPKRNLKRKLSKTVSVKMDQVNGHAIIV